jgi:hypothetical protein
MRSRNKTHAAIILKIKEKQKDTMIMSRKELVPREAVRAGLLHQLAVLSRIWDS